jgi:hypothetical protein
MTLISRLEQAEAMTDPNQIASIEIPAGMVEWHGQTKEPPEDWDGGAYLCRDGKMYFLNGWDWGHGTHCDNLTADWDRIAYTPRAIIERDSNGK